MLRTLRTIFAGIAALAALATERPGQAQTTYDPIFFCAVVGDQGNTRMRTVEGEAINFTRQVPTIASVRSNTPSNFVTGIMGFNDWVIRLELYPLDAVTEPSYTSFLLDYYAGEPSGTGECYLVVFATAEHRDAFLYYVQQRIAAATHADYVYFTALASYEFWLGQEDEGLALYTLYTGLGDYYYFTTVDANPQFAAYYYYYYRGLGAYYYFEGIGDSASAALAFAYHLELANQSLL